MDVQLCGDLPQASFVCPGEPVTFTCMTVGSPFLAWSSYHYVSETGSSLFFSSLEDMVGTTRTSLNGASISNLTNVDNNVLESTLYFHVSDQYSTSQIICINTASGVNATINFNVGKKIILDLSVTLLQYLLAQGACTCPQVRQL